MHPRTKRSIEIAEAICNLPHNRPYGIVALSKAVGVGRSTMYRYLSSARDAGYVEMTDEGYETTWMRVATCSPDAILTAVQEAHRKITVSRKKRKAAAKEQARQDAVVMQRHIPQYPLGGQSAKQQKESRTLSAIRKDIRDATDMLRDYILELDELLAKLR